MSCCLGGKSREAVRKEEVDSNAAALHQRDLAALLTRRLSPWSAWMAALGKHLPNNLLPWGGNLKRRRT